MARGRSPRVSGGAASPPVADRDRIVDAALALIARDGWRRLSMAGIAIEADLPILAVYRIFGSKPAILDAFFRRVDETVLAALPEVAEDERPRDRVFDLLMRRFDALGPYRDALAVLGRELPTDPPAALCSGARLLRSIGWILEAAGIPAHGLSGMLAVKLTAVAYLATLRVWLRDGSPDLASTMAELDRRLRRIERWYGAGRAAPRREPGAAAS